MRTKKLLFQAKSLASFLFSCHSLFYCLGLSFTVCSLYSLSAEAQVLDLSRLPQYEFMGEDSIHQRSPCHMWVDPVARDALRRPFQDFHLWSENIPLANYKLRLHSAQNLRSPDSATPQELQYLVAISDYDLQITSSRSDPLDIHAFELFDKSGVTGTAKPVIQCDKVHARRRGGSAADPERTIQSEE